MAFIFVRTVINFWKKVRKTDGCWLWTGAKCQGYGQFRFRDLRVMAHVFSWFLETGEWPSEGMEIHHKCHVRACVRPSHLEEISPGDNRREANLRHAALRKT